VRKLVSNFLALAVTLLFLASCGYTLGHGELSEKYSTISVPYVKGDWNGEMTSNLVKKMSQSGAFSYRPEGGALLLNVEIKDYRDENIGFRYDRNKKGKLTHSIIPTETRIIAIAEVTLLDAGSCQPVIAPVLISASVEFDHDYYSCRHGINIFSLGQLTDYDAAYDDVYRPLNEALSQKIVDYISNFW
jgi:hypothetical protein